MEVNTETSASFLIIRVSGEMRLWGQAGEQERPLTLLRAVEAIPGPVVLNMTGITRLDTSGIGALVRILIECSKREIELRVVLPRGFACEVLRRVRIFEQCASFESEAAATAIVQGAGG